MTIETTDVASKIEAALTKKGQKTPYDAASNPVGDRTVVDLMHGHGVLTSADQFPALDMTPKSALGYQMEQVRTAGLTAGKMDKSAKRMAQARERAAVKKQMDDIACSKVKPSKERLAAAWEIVLPLEPVIRQGALAKKAWASRFLGSNADDLPQMAIEAMVLVLAKSTEDLTILRTAALELGEQQARTGKMPGEQVSKEEKRERKQIGKARKWLMGLVNNRIMGALVDSYTAQRNLRWDNIDLVATVMANISGPADDAYIQRHKADRAPSFLGTRFQQPDGIDGNLLAQAIAGAISEHRLDPLAELLTDPENLRTDGSFSWSRNAQQVFLLSPKGGAPTWDLIERATAHLADPRKAQADAARMHVRSLFEWMPDMIVQTVDSFDFHAVGRVVHCKRVNVVMESKFESMLDKKPRSYLPALTYATPQDAGRALSEHLANLVNGEDVVSSVVFA